MPPHHPKLCAVERALFTQDSMTKKRATRKLLLLLLLAWTMLAACAQVSRGLEALEMGQGGGWGLIQVPHSPSSFAPCPSLRHWRACGATWFTLQHDSLRRQSKSAPEIVGERPTGLVAPKGQETHRKPMSHMSCIPSNQASSCRSWPSPGLCSFAQEGSGNFVFTNGF